MCLAEAADNVAIPGKTSDLTATVMNDSMVGLTTFRRRRKFVVYFLNITLG